MKNKTAFDRRAGWRDRFLEIAREAERTAPRSLVVAQGLRLRLRSAAFAGLKRARPA